jgi:hypothetical protein
LEEIKLMETISIKKMPSDMHSLAHGHYSYAALFGR